MSLRTVQGWIAQASRVVGFTGAGISTESGIPDFRGDGGKWKRNRIVDYREFLESEEGRVEYWRQKVNAWPAMREAQPNAGHRAFVKLHKGGKLAAMVTQNIDRLHHRSGLPADKVLELHGTTTEIECLSCGDRISSDEACDRVHAGEKAPRCRECGGFLKPATVSFGQSMPADVMTRAIHAAATSDLLLAVGSSLVVEPAASIPRIAKRAGARLIIVNRERTPLDDIADWVVHGEIGAVLPEMVGGPG